MLHVNTMPSPAIIILQLMLATIITAISPSDWRPVGQGDPLIDPTHVYSPPMVENVHYWLEPRHQPRVELSSVTHKGIPLGFSQVYQHYQKYPPSQHQLMDTGSYPKNTILEQYTGSGGHQNYGFPAARKNPGYTMSNGNYPLNQNSMNSFTHILEPIVMPLTTEHGLLDDEYVEMSTLPSTSIDPQILSLSLKPPPEHAVTVGQVAGWPQISTHLQPANLFTINNQRMNTANTLPSSTSYRRSPSQEVSKHITTTKPSQSSSVHIVAAPSTTTTTTTKPPPTSQPVSLVIEGHSKVKKYGPLPDSLPKSVKVINRNHLVDKNACKDCIDLPIAKVNKATGNN